MARQIVIDASVLRLWAVRGLLLGLGDREPAIISPRWSTAALAELRAGITADLAARRDAASASDDAGRITDAMTAAFPEAEVTGVPGNLELDLLDRRDADVAAAAVVAGALTVTTTSPGHFPPTHVAHIGLTAMPPDDLLLELYANDPWKVFHTTMVYARTLRTGVRTHLYAIDQLERDVPRFAEIIRVLLPGLPANQPPIVFAATHGQVAPAAPLGDLWCIACDPVPCPGHDGSRIRVLGTDASCLADECAFVGVTRTAHHWTLVWRHPDESTLLQAVDEMEAEHLNPRIARYSPAHGPALDYWDWMLDGR